MGVKIENDTHAGQILIERTYVKFTHTQMRWNSAYVTFTRAQIVFNNVPKIYHS